MSVVVLVVEKVALICCVLLMHATRPLHTYPGYEAAQRSPFSSLFYNAYDYADAESYGTNLFIQLYEHMNEIKRQQDQCGNIPVPKTVLTKKYFNPEYQFETYKYWYPPRDYLNVILWAQNEAFRNSLFLSYMLQDNNAEFPPGWLYLYLSTAAQLHSLQTIGFNSHRSVKGIKLPFESNEVFKVNWWKDKGMYQKFDKPFALYASQPIPNDHKYVRVIDFGTGGYATDYTGHAFLEAYIYDRQQFILNNTFEYSRFWRRPFDIQEFKTSSISDFNINKILSPENPLYKPTAEKIDFVYEQGQQNANYYRPDLNPEYIQNQNNPNIQFQQQPSPASINPSPTLVLTNPTLQYRQPETSYANFYQLQPQPFQNPNVLPITLKPNIHRLDQYSPFVYQYKDKVPITSWDPIVDNSRNNLNRYPNKDSPIGFDQWYVNSINENIGLENLKSMNENPFVLKTLEYIDTYRFAKVWWNNETYFKDNKQDYVFRIKPEERYYKFSGAKFETGTTWTSPYFWCVDPTNWLVTARAPIWATNDFQYKNKIFFSKDTLRYVGLSEVVLNYEELDVNQCPNDRQRNAFGSTALCDTTAECLPIPYYGLASGGYECQCLPGFHYPADVQGPYRGKELGNNLARYPLCLKSHGLLQYPNWVSKNSFDYPAPSVAASLLEANYNNRVEKRDVPSTPLLQMLPDRQKEEEKLKRKKRFFDRRNNFEKFRDSIFADQEQLIRQCNMFPFQDVILLNEDDERFVLNLRSHADEVFKAQTAQALRIAHLVSAYLQLHSPIGWSSVNSQNDFSGFTNFDYNNLRPDPQLDEYIMIGEVMSTLISNYPIQEVHIFFNGTEYQRQKFYAAQNTLSFGLSAIRSDVELILNRTNDDSHLSKSWYKYSIEKFMYGGRETIYGGTYRTDQERDFYKTAGPFENGLFGSTFRMDRYGIEMNLRRSFDGQTGNVDLPPKFYDAPSSGIWYGPYYDCQKKYMKTKTTLRMVYSVPIITSISKLPIGFTSVVIGSDLKWWRINPCDTSKEKNMFRHSHKCDLETTICMYQEMPEFETGYYLASYKCICKANYEFPFVDYGFGYFDGATVEKEYEKKMRGMPNIFERLKCRPFASTNIFTGLFSTSSALFKPFDFIILFVILMSLFLKVTVQ